MFWKGGPQKSRVTTAYCYGGLQSPNCLILIKPLETSETAPAGRGFQQNCLSLALVSTSYPNFINLPSTI